MLTKNVFDFFPHRFCSTKRKEIVNQSINQIVVVVVVI